MSNLVVYNIGQLVTVRNKQMLVQGDSMNDVNILSDAYLVINNGKFTEIGVGDGYLAYIDIIPSIDGIISI